MANRNSIAKVYTAKYFCITVLCLFLSTQLFSQNIKIDSSSKENFNIEGIEYFDNLTPTPFLSKAKVTTKSLNSTFTQTQDKSKTFFITSNNYSDSIQMVGTIDGANTFSCLSKYDQMEGAFSQFFNLKTIVISNNGNKPITAPRFIINNERNWYDMEGVSTNAIGNKDSVLGEKSLLDMWRFVKNNTTHFSPAGMDEYSDYFHPKMLLTYGYGTCDIAMRMIYSILCQSNYLGEYHLMTHHTVIDVIDNGKKNLLDPDTKVFYLDLDNKTLSGFDKVMNDRYLIQRTKHFGPSIYYNKNEDVRWSMRYNLYPFNPLKSLKKEINLQYTSDFILKPHESVIYRWDKAEKYYHSWPGSPQLPESFLENIISNSKYTLSTNFKSSNFNAIFEESNHIQFSQNKSNPAIYSAGENPYFIYRVNLPFPLLDAQLKGKFRNNSINDSVEIFISLDGETTWKKIWVSKKTGIYEDSISIGQYFNYPLPNHTSIPPSNYSLKFVLKPKSSLSACGLDSLYIENSFQISKRFLPELQLGNNIISYQDFEADSTVRNIEVTVNWQETSENTPPNKVEQPVFPLDNTQIDSLYFGFEWQAATDVDGDDIVDYEFFLADHPEMNYPLSPNFNLYVSAFENGIQPFFKVKETGWLNDGQTYYWKVRAKDSRGTWGEWSNVWSFTPHGVMRPLSLKIDSISTKGFSLSWSANKNGYTPEYYKIYSSNESNGFSPSEATLLTTTTDTTLNIVYNGISTPKTFYRIAACEYNGQESLPSEVLSIPFPSIFIKADSIYPDSVQYLFNLATNRQYYPYFYYKNDTTFYAPPITLINRPNWLSQTDTGYIGTVDSAIWKRVLFDSTYRNISFRIENENSEYLKEINISLSSTYKNAQPLPFIADTQAIEDTRFKTFIFTNDGDALYGDKNKFEITQIPSWLKPSTKGDTLWLDGRPDSIDVLKENIISLRVTDSYGLSKDTSFAFNITPAIYLPIIMSKPDTLLPVKREYSYRVEINDLLSVDSLTFKIEDGPEWLSIGEGNTLIGTPSPKDIGVYLIVVKVEYKSNVFGIQKFIIIVKPDTAIASLAYNTARENSSFETFVTIENSEDVPENIYRFSITELPDWLHITSIQADTIWLAGMPYHSNIGKSSLKVETSDNYNGSSEYNYPIYVRYLNHAPQITSSPIGKVRKGEAYVYTIRTEDRDVAYGDSLRITLLEAPEWLYLDERGIISGIPTDDNMELQKVSLKVEDLEGASNTQEFFVSVLYNDIKETASPNPFTDWVTFIVNLTENAQITLNVYTIQGSKVYTESLSCSAGINHIKWNGSILHKGIYEVEIQVQENGLNPHRIVHKMIKK